MIETPVTETPVTETPVTETTVQFGADRFYYLAVCEIDLRRRALQGLAYDLIRTEVHAKERLCYSRDLPPLILRGPATGHRGRCPNANDVVITEGLSAAPN